MRVGVGDTHFQLNAISDCTRLNFNSEELTLCADPARSREVSAESGTHIPVMLRPLSNPRKLLEARKLSQMGQCQSSERSLWRRLADHGTTSCERCTSFAQNHGNWKVPGHESDLSTIRSNKW